MKRRIVLTALAVGVIVGAAIGAQYGYDRTLGSDANGSGTLSPPGSINGSALADDAVLVVWSNGSRADRHEIFRDGVSIANTNLLSFTDFDLEPGTTYTYRVRAGDGEQWSAMSDAVELTTDSDAD